MFPCFCLGYQAWSLSPSELFQPLPDLRQGGVVWWVTSWLLQQVWTLLPKPSVCLSSTSTTSCFQVQHIRLDVAAGQWGVWVKPSIQSLCTNEVNYFALPPSPTQVNPFHLRWLWPSYWHSCTTASCHRAISPSIWQSNLAPRSSLTQAFPRRTHSRDYALRKVPQSWCLTVL